MMSGGEREGKGVEDLLCKREQEPPRSERHTSCIKGASNKVLATWFYQTYLE
jgi:hypothetical protein